MRQLIKRTALSLLLCITAALPAAAQNLSEYDYENLAFRGIGMDVARIWPNKVASTLNYGFRFDLGFLGPGVRVVPSIGYWSSELKRSELQRFANQLNRLPALQQRDITITADELGSVEWSDLALGVDLQVVWTTPVLNAYTYAGIGGQLHALNGQGESVQETFVEDLLDSTTAGVAIMGGVEFQPLRSVRLFTEARFTVLNDIRYPGLKVGAMIMFARRDTAAVRGTR